MLSPEQASRSRAEEPSVGRRSTSAARDEVVRRAPEERNTDERELHKQRASVAASPRDRQPRQPFDAQVRACGDHHGDEPGREAGEAEEDLAPTLGCSRPDDGDEGHESADPEHRRS